MENICNLFRGETLVPTLIVAVAAFMVGLIVEMLVCKMSCKGRPEASSKDASPSDPRKQKAESKLMKRHPAPADGSIEIYVGNLSYDLTEDQLRKEFEAFGTVNSARIITNRYNNKSKGFGFVHMPNRAEVDAAVAALNDKEILGRKLKCNEAKNLD